MREEYPLRAILGCALARNMTIPAAAKLLGATSEDAQEAVKYRWNVCPDTYWKPGEAVYQQTLAACVTRMAWAS